MIKITCLDDLKNNSLDDEIKWVVETELNRIFTSCQIDNISDVGSMFVIEADFELDSFSAFGLTEPIEQNLFEFVNRVHIKRCSQEDIVLLGCIVVSDDYAIDIIVRESLLSENHKRIFTSTFLCEEHLETGSEN